jgi:50S ribosomal subunit-associated GTPase HflX
MLEQPIDNEKLFKKNKQIQRRSRATNKQPIVVLIGNTNSTSCGLFDKYACVNK